MSQQEVSSSALPPVPTTKILAIGHFHAPLTSEQRKQILPHEVADTVRMFLSGKIDQWWYQQDGNGPVFLLNVAAIDEAKSLIDSLPLGRNGLMAFDFIELAPLRPLYLLIS
ncbi:MAG: hypothetical protein JO322_01320 [Candidatus Eremiobacteraeota bacterium]|nr:hypothetical protein [Candidatus Eremiobacteraeota bacterium]